MSKNKSFSETSATRYSLALYELAKESNQIDEVEKNCSSLIKLIFNSDEFQSLIKNPTIKKDELNSTVLKISDQYKLNSLLIKFLDFWTKQENMPDVITGWNIRFFDIPYLINRTARILGMDMIKKFSPWGMVEHKIELKAPMI